MDSYFVFSLPGEKIFLFSQELCGKKYHYDFANSIT